MIVIFNGPPGSGKDEAADFFKKHYGYKHLSFKHVLFLETYKHFNVSKDWFMLGYKNRDRKELPEKKLNGMSRREAMIYVSEKVIKPKYGAAFFGEQVSTEIELEKNYAISDGGFVEELKPIIEKVGNENILLVQLVREGCDYENDSRRYFNGNLTKELIHGSVSNINEDHILPERFNIETYRIYNNAGLSNFHSALRNVQTCIRNEARYA